MEAIIRNRESALAELVRNPSDLQLVANKFTDAIVRSFKQDQERSRLTFIVTEAEFKSRFKICEKWFRIMRGDCGYTVEKALDFLGTALRTELDGGSFQPPSNEHGWSPSVLDEKL